MRFYLPILLFVFISKDISAQLSGLFGENAAAISAAILSKGTLELEPTYSYTLVKSAWEGETLTTLPADEISSSVTWRVTYGLNEHWEIGFGAPTNLSALGFSVKRDILTKEVFALGVAAGFTQPTLEAPMDVAKAPEFKTSYGIAVLGYWALAQSSFDLNVQYQNYFIPDQSNAPPTLFLNGDWGQWIMPDKLRVMMSVGYQSTQSTDTRSTLWSLYPAIQYDFLNHFSLVLNTQHDFAGYNAPKSLGLNVTLTTIW